MTRSSLPVAARVVALAALLALGVAYGQHDEADTEEEPVPALVSLGVEAGFPAYQTVAVRGAIQTGPFGMALRAGYGPGAGAYGGVTLRAYPPLPGMPVPIWVGGGGGLSAGGLVPHAAVGVHVPLARRLRLDVEGGAAWPELGLERTLTPHLAVGVSYAFATELRPVAGTRSGFGRDDERRTASCEPGPPDPSLLDAAFDRAVDGFLDDARATYGSLYRSLRYDLDPGRPDLDGDRATFDVDYDGSVVEIASGERISASGSATAVFRWTGCGWSLADLDY
jgi:hypothetical protein